MDTDLIRNTIQLAKQREEISSLLVKQLQLASSHQAIQSQACGSDSHYDFTIKYIELVPDLFEITLAAAEKGNILKLVQTYIEIVSGYFLEPRNSATVDMIELLNEAYLAHRLIEELNDQIEFALGVPLVHFDMMQANLIIHHLIGDAFANELDKVVSVSIERETVSRAVSHAHLDADWIKSLKEGRRALSGEVVFCFGMELGSRPGANSPIQ